MCILKSNFCLVIGFQNMLYGMAWNQFDLHFEWLHLCLGINEDTFKLT